MSDRRITKIKFKKELITIEWEQYQAKTEDRDKFSLTSKDEPLPSFPEAMAALAKDVEVICELPIGERGNITPTGISHSYTDNDSFIVVTAQRKLLSSRSPMNINTPAKSMEGDDEFAADSFLIDDIDTLEQEAFDYIDGQRAQQKLDFEEDGGDEVGQSAAAT